MTASYVTTFCTVVAALRISRILPLKRCPGNASTVKYVGMPTCEPPDVPLGDVRVDLHLGEVLRDREERRRRERGGDRLPDVDAARDDDAVDGRDDVRVREVHLRLVERRRRLLRGSPCCMSTLACAIAAVASAVSRSCCAARFCSRKRLGARELLVGVLGLRLGVHDARLRLARSSPAPGRRPPGRAAGSILATSCPFFTCELKSA